MWHKYKILTHSQKVKQIKDGEFPAPVFATLQLSYACNQNCQSCSFALWNTEKFIPTKEECLNIIQQLIDYGVKAFEFGGGGEPTVLPYLDELIRFIVDNGATYGLITNGVNISDSLASLLKETATYVRVSLETGDSELYTQYKRVPIDHFNIAIENVEKLIGGKAEIGLKFDLDKNLSSENHIKSSLLIADQLGVDMAAFKCMTGETELSYDQKVNLSNELNRYLSNYSGRVKFINSIVYDKWFGQCWLTPLHTVIDGKGDVFMCCYYYRDDVHKKEDHCIGNVFKIPFKKLWGSDVHKTKLDGIDFKNCRKVDCKFFNHHRIAEALILTEKANII